MIADSTSPLSKGFVRARVLLFIGQPVDSGSESPLPALKDQAERENISIYALTLPEYGKAFVSDTFSLDGVSRSEKGGFRAGADLGRLITVVRRGDEAALGIALRSAYMLSYYPNAIETRYHAIRIEVGVPGAGAYVQPGVTDFEGSRLSTGQKGYRHEFRNSGEIQASPLFATCAVSLGRRFDIIRL